jgi:hypothetical protein
MDDLAQHSPWRSRPRGDEAKPPFTSPIVFRLGPAMKPLQGRRAYPYAHRLGTAERGTPRILSLLS